MNNNFRNLSIKFLGLVVVGLVLSGCTNALNNFKQEQNSVNDKVIFKEDSKVTVDNPEYDKVSSDDSLDTLDKELDQTVIDDENFSDLGL